jgi:glycosyltransferase involved in cell wall biosynthesis
VKKDSVLTVAVCDSGARMGVKGVDLLLDAARLVPSTRFLLIGIGEPFLQPLAARAPANVEIRGRVPREELLTLYRNTKVYCQPSRFEGLPNAVCEAMLCGCVPVCTDVGGTRTAVDGAGLLVPWGDPAALASSINEALAWPAASGVAAREAIAGRFTLEKREEGLVRLVRGLSA